MKKFIIPAIILTGLVLVYTNFTLKTNGWDKDTPLGDVLIKLGDKKPIHSLSGEPTKEQIKQGRELVTKGVTKGPDGKKTKRQSIHFVCTDCHNIVKENPNNGVNSSDDRLKYAMENKIPYLQGTTLYGIVNRTSWYNDDYLKKYGKLVESSRDTLENAVQLCATVCSQGRAFEDWEMDAVMAYLWSIQNTLGDLNLTDEEMSKLNSAELGSKQDDLIKMLKNKYVTVSHATFLDPHDKEGRLYGEDGDPDKGKFIYKSSCMHCHHHNGVTELKLDPAKVTMRMFNKNLKKENDWNIYHIVREGTHPIAGYKPYMPLYTKERLSPSQVEDLIAYIKSRL